MSDDPKLSQRYRDLPREEPPRAVDDAILAASRRAVQARPAPLVAPAGRRRWYVPVAAAAVITLAVAVTLHVQHDRPGEEVDTVAPAMEAQKTPAPAEAPKAAAGQAEAPARAQDQLLQERRAPQPFAKSPSGESAGALSSGPAAAPATPEAPPAARVDQQRERNDVAAATAGARASRDEQQSARPAETAPAPQAAPAPQRAPAPEPAAKPLPESSGRVAARLMQRATTPEGELERIAELRRLGRHEEADKALAEFRKRYPDYRLSDEMKAKVEKRQ